MAHQHIGSRDIRFRKKGVQVHHHVSTCTRHGSWIASAYTCPIIGAQPGRFTHLEHNLLPKAIVSAQTGFEYDCWRASTHTDDVQITSADINVADDFIWCL